MPGDLASVRAGENAARAPQPVRHEPLPLEWVGDIEPQFDNLWLVDEFLPSLGLVLLYGHPGSGKSFLALDIAFHVALGLEWFGRYVEQGLVIYVGAEGFAGLRNRIVAFRQYHDLKSRPPLALIPTPIDLQAPDADVGRLIETIRQAAASLGIRVALIVIDTISKTFGAGKENTDDMATYVANCGRVAAEFECCVMPVHHRPKDAESEEPRGHSSLKAGVDTVILVEAGAIKKARLTKQKDAEVGDPLMFTLKVVGLGENSRGKPVTSCVVEPTEVSADADAGLPTRRLTDNDKLALGKLKEAVEASGIPIPAEIPDGEINRMRVGKVVSRDAWRAKMIAALGTDRDSSRDTGKKIFQRASVRLQNDGIVRGFGDWVWLTFASQTQRDSDRDTLFDQAGQAGTVGGPPYGGNPLFVPVAVPVPPKAVPSGADPFDDNQWEYDR